MKRISVEYCGEWYDVVYALTDDVLKLVSISDGSLLTTDKSCFDKELIIHIEATIIANEVV